MTPLLPAQRAAEDFDRVLSGTATPAVADRYADLLDLTATMRAQPDVLPRADFAAELRSRLMTAAATELVAAGPVVRHLAPARTRRNRRLGTLAASLVIVGGGAGMAAAASGSLPGEALYPVKRGVESAATAVHFGDAAKGTSLLGQAATRLDEVSDLRAGGSSDVVLLGSTLDAFRSAADEGSAKLFTAYQSDSNPEDIVAVRAFTAQQMQQIAALSGSSARLDALLVEAADTVADIDQQARVLCSACAPQESLSPPESLAAAAAAASAANLLARPVSQAVADIALVQKAQDAQLADLRSEAQKAAGELPKVTPDEVTGGAAGLPDVSPQDGPVRSTITSDGTLVPSLTTGGGVKGLLDGVIGTAPAPTSGLVPAPAVPTLPAPVQDGLQDLGDQAKKVTGDLLPGS